MRVQAGEMASQEKTFELGPNMEAFKRSLIEDKGLQGEGIACKKLMEEE